MKFLTAAIISPFLFSYSFVLTDIKEKKFIHNRLAYEIFAKKKVVKVSKPSIFYKHYIKKNNYYTDGYLKEKNIKIYFKKMYKIGKKIYLHRTKFHIKNINYRSRECTYESLTKTLSCFHVIIKDKTLHSKLNFKIKLN